MLPRSILLSIAAAISLAPFRVRAEVPYTSYSFAVPIDAVSLALEGKQYAEVSAFLDGTWSAWQTVERDEDMHPSESGLLIFPSAVTEIRVRSERALEIHPVTISRGPASTRLAASDFPGQHILSRSEWGADESLRFKQAQSSSSQSQPSRASENEPTTPSSRIADCEQAQRDYPEEFTITSTVTRDASGQEYLWPLKYSEDVRLIAVHHTAFLVGGDTRSAAERVRALYQYHARSLGWGDIGYHYLIDEAGQIYEGKAGGPKVVGGHAYCNNVGTVGVALLGNFEIEQPTQQQMKSLQWLIDHLGGLYDLDMRAPVRFHGKQFLSPIVGHRDLLSTTCPGYYVTSVLGQVIAHVKSKNLAASITFPRIQSDVAQQAGSPSPAPVSAPKRVFQGTLQRGSTDLSTNPGGRERLTMIFTAGEKVVPAGSEIAIVALSSPDIGLFLENGSEHISVYSSLSPPRDLAPGERSLLSFLVQAPMNAGTYSFQIGDVRYSLTASGRRVRSEAYTHPFASYEPARRVVAAPILVRAPPPSPRSVPTSTLLSRTLPLSARSITRAAARRKARRLSVKPQATVAMIPVRTERETHTKELRVLLTVGPMEVLTFAAGGSVNGRVISSADRVTIKAQGALCEATIGSTVLTDSILIFAPSPSGTVRLQKEGGQSRSYRGKIECRVVDGQLALINELALEEYLAGLSEEPDSEPYEKQRAFAIAARTYARYYLDTAHRKFPGKPYDASDSPATFQAYAGMEFEQANPNWVKAVRVTAGKVLTASGELIRPPYFSSDPGQTRSPLEAGWQNFPFAEVFASKPDPWCSGMPLRGHGVGMSGCGAEGQANDGKTAEEILQYYYPGTTITTPSL